MPDGAVVMAAAADVGPAAVQTGVLPRRRSRCFSQPLPPSRLLQSSAAAGRHLAVEQQS